MLTCSCRKALTSTRTLAARGQPVELEGATLNSPANTPGALAVSALGGGWGTADRLAFYSSYGQGVVNLTAPGGDRGPRTP